MQLNKEPKIFVHIQNDIKDSVPLLNYKGSGFLFSHQKLEEHEKNPMRFG